ncbi:MAG: DNA polymerase III subunit beta [Clostridiales bacterium]|jgi:DNA polymerase-3 subunit beta|nr:DNA polymerase III subunit beta [Clostridiales bacterium]HOA33067.1 DNA polymerase III subunit beta [Clostridiales bacterium]HOJ35113.1 DNA polymerase III subunit beta [Clostridiales bacterium]HOL79200.1 DNA polymerase III subunit beta [Clostridiales bacterium]HPP67960.1 DNA polymerase III subunit beta [Clostridiales bacterium]
MKLVCNTSVLSQACQNVQRAASTKSVLPTIEGIFISAKEGFVELCGYDLEFGIRTKIEAEIEREGAVVINARTLCDILKHLPFDTVTIENDERNNCRIYGGETSYTISGISAAEYPEIPSVKSETSVSVKGESLRDMVRQTIFSVSTDDSKMVHRGIKFEIEDNVMTLIALDGRRLALRRETVEYKGEKMSFVVPAKTMSEVTKLIDEETGDIEINLGMRHIIFKVGGYSVVSRLLDGEFLDYRSALPKNKTTIVRIKTKDFADSIERASLVVTEKFKSPLKFIFDDSSVKITGTTALGTASDRTDAVIEGSRVEIGFNYRYLTEALRACDTDEVVIELSGPLSPICIVPTSGDSFLYLILPVKLNN